MAKVGLVQIVAFAVAASAVACSVDVRGSEVSTREEKRFTVSTTEPVELKLRTFDGTLVVPRTTAHRRSTTASGTRCRRTTATGPAR